MDSPDSDATHSDTEGRATAHSEESRPGEAMAEVREDAPNADTPQARDTGAVQPGDALHPTLAFKLVLPNFEGPLDLLLHLIHEHKIDILDIPIALITEIHRSSHAMRKITRFL